MLKAEMDRLTSEMNDAETAMQAAARSVTDLEGMLDVALLIAGECERHYAKAEPRVRRMLNQGLFAALYVNPDGCVERFELTEPFATLLDGNLLADLAEERPAGRALAATQRIEVREGRVRQDRLRPSNVLTASSGCPEVQTQSGARDRRYLEPYL
jgi:hypothetical protein